MVETNLDTGRCLKLTSDLYEFSLSERNMWWCLRDKKKKKERNSDIFNINDKLTQYKINWRKHIQRMDDNRLPQKNLNYKPEGRRNIGNTSNEMGRWFPGGRNRPRGLSFIVNDNV